MYSFAPSGVCADNISFDIIDGKVRDVRFAGGCSGNTQGVSVLADGRPVEEVIALLSGIKCGRKETSCPAQLAIALSEASRQGAAAN